MKSFYLTSTELHLHRRQEGKDSNDTGDEKGEQLAKTGDFREAVKITRIGNIRRKVIRSRDLQISNVS